SMPNLVPPVPPVSLVPSVPPVPRSPNDLEKLKEDRWTSSPPSVTSYLTYRSHDPSDDRVRRRYTSVICGIGWRFQLDESFRYQKSNSNHRVQELVGQVNVTLLPHLCSSMSLSDFEVNVKVSYAGKPGHEENFTGISIRSDTMIGTYEEPLYYKGPVQLEITLTFNPTDGLVFPTTPSINTQKALHHSLDHPSFVDTKFYLFSARIDGQPAHPKAVYAKSLLLVNASNYMRDLLSAESDFAGGSACDIFQEVPEEIAKLDPDVYDYDDDSDLEDEEGEKNVKSPQEVHEKSPVNRSQGTVPDSEYKDGRAFVINGTAYKTWKAFLFYTYTNSISFNDLKSQRKTAPRSPIAKDTKDFVRCSPKSMYRFADYADLPDLKALAKGAITKGLSRFNIVEELFSVFTSKYQEIIELEVEFLIQNFSGSVRKDFDEMLQMIVLGTQTHAFRILAFTMRRLLGEAPQAAWKALEDIGGFQRWRPEKRNTKGNKGIKAGSAPFSPSGGGAGVSLGGNASSSQESQHDASERALHPDFAMPKEQKSVKGKGVEPPQDNHRSNAGRVLTVEKAEQESGEKRETPGLGAVNEKETPVEGSGGNWGFSSWGSVNEGKPSNKKSLGAWGSDSKFGSSFGGFSTEDSGPHGVAAPSEPGKNTKSPWDDWASTEKSTPPILSRPASPTTCEAGTPYEAGTPCEALTPCKTPTPVWRSPVKTKKPKKGM
ncbi:hypothetical protein AN958_07860, partial [Leucoagaricus sp. SymC.cos]